MIIHYQVSFKGHKCALVGGRAIGAGWLLRCHKGESPALFSPVIGDVERKAEISRVRREIVRIIKRTEQDRKHLRGSLTDGLPIVQRLLADKNDTRKRARRWRIVPVHRGPKGKQS